jgi:hypothetical protein
MLDTKNITSISDVMKLFWIVEGDIKNFICFYPKVSHGHSVKTNFKQMTSRGAIDNSLGYEEFFMLSKLVKPKYLKKHKVEFIKSVKLALDDIAPWAPEFNPDFNDRDVFDASYEDHQEMNRFRNLMEAFVRYLEKSNDIEYLF